MGNITSSITYYLGWQDVESYSDVLAQTQVLHQDNLTNTTNNMYNNIDINQDQYVTKAEMEQYFKSLTDKLDQDKDGIVSKEELEDYVKEQISITQEEVEKWRSAYNTIFKEYEDLKESLRVEEGRVLEVSNISTRILKDYIQREIIEDKSNIRMLPDPIERRLYLKIYKTILKSLEKISDKTALDILGHRISFAIQPIVDGEQ